VRTERCLGGLVCPSSLCSQRPQGEVRNRHRDYLWNFITAGSYSRLLAFQSACNYVVCLPLFVCCRKGTIL